jgi:hypothetical protein
MPATSQSTTPMTVVGIMEAQQALLGLSNQEICAGIGFEREIALRLIKQGSMRFPLNKVSALATVLQLDAVQLLKIALRESDPALAKLIEETFDPLRLSATEIAQIKHQRSLSGDAAGAPIALQGNDVIALVGV